jgi:hypothetical protein
VSFCEAEHAVHNDGVLLTCVAFRNCKNNEEFGSMNCGKNATKNKIPFGFVTADRKPWLNSFDDPRLVRLAVSAIPNGSDLQT